MGREPALWSVLRAGVENTILFAVARLFSVFSGSVGFWWPRLGFLVPDALLPALRRT